MEYLQLRNLLQTFDFDEYFSETEYKYTEDFKKLLKNLLTLKNKKPELIEDVNSGKLKITDIKTIL